MTTDLSKILYICPPFKGVRTNNTRPSFIKLRVVWYENAHNSWALYYSRDSMGLGWISVKRNNSPIVEPDTRFEIKDLDFNRDQMFRGWLPLNLCIRSRKGRETLLRQIGNQAVEYFLQNPKKLNICIPRMCIFKEADSRLSYAFELIDGDNAHTVACSIGDENILDNPKNTTKGILYSPIHYIGGGVDADDIIGYNPRSRRDDDNSDGASDCSVENDVEENKTEATPEYHSDVPSPTNERVFGSSNDPLRQENEITGSESVEKGSFQRIETRRGRGRTVVKVKS